jgi:hypothetical protein
VSLYQSSESSIQEPSVENPCHGAAKGESHLESAYHRPPSTSLLSVLRETANFQWLVTVRLRHGMRNWILGLVRRRSLHVVDRNRREGRPDHRDHPWISRHLPYTLREGMPRVKSLLDEPSSNNSPGTSQSRSRLDDAECRMGIYRQ